MGDCQDRFDLDARRASCVLLNQHFLIDCGPHCSDAMRIAGVDAGDVRHLFLTHLHSDHFNPENVQKLADACYQKNGSPLNVWVSEEALLPPLEKVTVRRMKKFESYTVTDTLCVTGVDATHDAGTYPQHFVFESEGKKLMYATDGAWMLNSTYNYLRKAALSALIIDATVGDYEGDFRMAEHNSIPMIRLMLPSLKTFGIINADTALYLTHLAPSLHKSHAETASIVEPLGIKVAYDGLSISI